MTGPLTPRRTRRAAERDRVRREPAPPVGNPDTRRRRLGQLLFAAVAVAVLGVGGWLAFGDFVAPRGSAADGTIGVQASMAGFTPKEIVVAAGQEVTLDFWTQDSSIHLERGVHTLNSEDLGLAVELPGADAVAMSRTRVTFTAPTEPGTYEVYCDTCCGGRANPTMRGTVRVEA